MSAGGYRIAGRSGDWEIAVGLEVHAQVISEAKLFSSAPTAFGAQPNSQVSLVDAAMPGMLPVINRHCVTQAVRTGLALDAEINLTSVFDRKNYFYPDLPPGYQISQYSRPIVGKGRVVLDLQDGAQRTIGITRLHLEMDAGKSIHDRRGDATCVDLNRAGVALMEIVSEPDIRSPEEAGLYLRKLRSILRYIGTCDGNMEQGSLRADVNVSVRRPGEALGTRCEVKNLNSVRFVMKAIEVEAERQVAVLEDGGAIELETRLFDPERGETRSMRSKEEAHDYRYFPDPDLLPLTLDPAWVDEQRAHLPELPDARKARFVADYGLSAYDAGVLVAEREIAEYFEAVAAGRDGKQAANWVTGTLFGALNRGRHRDRTEPGPGGGPRRADRPGGGRHGLQPCGQGRVRGHGLDGQGRRHHHRGEGAPPGQRHGRHRGAGRSGDRREPRQGRGLPRRQDEARGLVRRSGDEGVRRQGQPQGGQRGAAGEARRIGGRRRPRRRD